MNEFGMVSVEILACTSAVKIILTRSVGVATALQLREHTVLQDSLVRTCCIFEWIAAAKASVQLRQTCLRT